MQTGSFFELVRFMFKTQAKQAKTEQDLWRATTQIAPH